MSFATSHFCCGVSAARAVPAHSSAAHGATVISALVILTSSADPPLARQRNEGSLACPSTRPSCPTSKAGNTLGPALPRTCIQFDSRLDLRLWVSVPRLGVGDYCLVADASISYLDAVLVVSPGSPGGGGPPWEAAWSGGCAGGFEVKTGTGGSAQPADINFVAVIP